ncbi:single-stranded DNA-binding protein [Streptacidiphilus neutrinimicus]|uniref:single-stranded DNA-binding protein n=1 Tax=Streptacidiphilus neutrinimicus TaxID=105420 RepID=UPI0005AAA32F|nr:single-stranded DNA-binding protein [Streptacidiphilus neutrinimicus]
MSVGETPITIVGNLTDDPELKFTPAGAALAKFTVASTPRTFDKATNQWRDGTGMFLRCTAWRELADHAAETLTRGMRVIVTGRLRQHNWQNEQGENRSMLAVEVDEIGPSLRFATAKVTKIQRPGSGQGAAGGDPWAGAGSDAEPPF